MNSPTLEASRLLETRIESANILIVDDIPQNLLAMRALLEDDGIVILCAQSGAQALELLLIHEVAVALLDVNMPELNGFDLAELIRSSPRTKNVPIIFLTASPQDPKRAFQGYDSGAVDFLHKPIEPNVILSKVKVFVELHQQRAMLRSHNERLERTLDLNEKMLAVMTHDLRTPLSVISLNARALSLGVLDSELPAVSRRIEDSADRMRNMIEQLFDFTRIRSGILRLEPKPADLQQVADQVLVELQQTYPSANIERLSVGNLKGVFDPERVRQIISNMVGNAIQNADMGAVTLVLDGSDVQRLRIEVRNPGEISAELLARIFEPFKGSFHVTQGLGLGLYIVDQFSKAHGGRAFVRSQGGEVRVSSELDRVVKMH